MILFVVLGVLPQAIAFGQTKEYIRLNGRVIAIESVGGGVDQSEYTVVSGNVPASVSTSTSFVARIRITNIGNTTWNSTDYRLRGLDSGWGITGDVPFPAGTNSVAPQGFVEFVLNATAPANSCSACPFRWQMVKSGVAFGAIAAPPLQVSAPATLNSVFVSQSGLSATLPAGVNFSVQLTFQNPAGAATWNSSTVRLVKQDGANPCSFGVSEVALGANVSPGGSSTFTINGVAPASAQTCTFQWQMREGSTFFGASFSQQVSFTVASYNSLPQSVILPSSLIRGQRFDATVSLLNPAGSATWDLRSSAGADQVILGSQSPANNLTWGVNTASSSATTVAAGSTASFSVQGRAPLAVSGAQVFDWQLRRGSSGWFGAIARPGTAVQVVSGTNAAQEIEISAPAEVNTGAAFTLTVRIKNTGTAVWWGLGASGTNAYQLKHTNAQNPGLWGISSVGLPLTYLDGGDTATFTIPLIAPNSAGQYTLPWRMEQVGIGEFGPTISRTISVLSANPRILNVQPVNGNGVESTFSAVFDGGPAPVHTARFLVNDGGVPHCYFEYNQVSGEIIIYNYHTGQRRIGRPGVVETLYNEYCYIKTGSSSVSRAGNVTTVSLRTGFLTSMAGTKNYYVSLLNTNIVDTGWQYQSSYTIPVQVGITLSPSNVVLSSGQSQQFTPTVTGTSNTAVSWLSYGWGTVSPTGNFVADTVTSTQNTSVWAYPAADTSKSASSNITVQPAASIVTITNFSPTNGQNITPTFSISASGGNAPIQQLTYYGNITQLNQGGCMVTWYPAWNYVVLSSNGGLGLGGYMGSGYLMNGYCTVNLWASSGFVSGNIATMNISLDYTIWRYQTLISQFARASNISGAVMPDWQYFGWWRFQ